MIQGYEWWNLLLIGLSLICFRLLVRWNNKKDRQWFDGKKMEARAGADTLAATIMNVERIFNVKRDRMFVRVADLVAFTFILMAVFKLIGWE